MTLGGAILSAFHRAAYWDAKALLVRPRGNQGDVVRDGRRDTGLDQVPVDAPLCRGVSPVSTRVGLVPGPQRPACGGSRRGRAPPFRPLRPPAWPNATHGPSHAQPRLAWPHRA